MHLPLNAGCIIAAFSILASGCVVNPDTPQTNEENESPSSQSEGPNESSDIEIVASSSGSSTGLSSDLQLDIYALERVGDDLLRLRAGITNNSAQGFPIYDAFADVDDPYTASRITLIDSDNQTRHLSFNQDDGSCFCNSFGQTIPAGETIDTWVVFPAPPSEVGSMIVTTPTTPPILDVPITQSSEAIDTPGLADPEIVDLTSITDNTEDQTGRSESSDEVSIILSSDVLFETNSAELSAAAQEILEQVAMEIDDASGTSISIDGHADNTGSDSVNVPLSEERAESVEDTLNDLISRNGITFEVEGHGSSDPIADNETEEGRERNRRVSVTFEK